MDARWRSGVSTSSAGPDAPTRAAGLLARSPGLDPRRTAAGLDAATQRGLLRLLEDLRHDRDLTVVVISHDFTGLEQLCHAPCTCATVCSNRCPPQPEVCHDCGHVSSTHHSPPTRPVVLLRPCPAAHPFMNCGRYQTSCGVRHFGAADVLSGVVSIGFVAATVLLAARIAHIPRGVLPSVPLWLWILIAFGGITAALAGGSPVIQVGAVSVGWAGC
ncbi:hypothetical protein I552_9778 [Mycobacterium xenopi 3993]|nr:hypothetical protein I552_9778 [Mycobacterium xenopi 3993]